MYFLNILINAIQQRSATETNPVTVAYTMNQQNLAAIKLHDLSSFTD